MIQEGLQLASGNYNFSTVCIQEVSLIVSNYFQETMFSVASASSDCYFLMGLDPGAERSLRELSILFADVAKFY